MNCEWKYSGQKYGRGSKDIDTYRCVNCGGTTWELEDTEPSKVVCKPRKAMDYGGQSYEVS